MQIPVLSCVDLTQGGAITLYDWMADGVRDGRNLIRTAPDGAEIWRAKPTFFGEAGQQDCFTKFTWDGADLIAWTWSCYRVSVDFETGAVTTLEFTK